MDGCLLANECQGILRPRTGDREKDVILSALHPRSPVDILQYVVQIAPFQAHAALFTQKLVEFSASSIDAQRHA